MMQAPAPVAAKSSDPSRRDLWPPVFIVGCPRSGTTLLRMMLDSHPDLAIPPESHFIPKVWALRRRYERDGAAKVERVASDIMRTHRFKEWGLPDEDVWLRLRSLTKPGIAEVIDAFFVAYAERDGKPRWGDKTPGYSIEMVGIAELFPTARFVHLIRDGRDVAMSIRANFQEVGDIDAALVWATRVRKGRAQGRSLGSDRYLEVRYEDLVKDPQNVLTLICDFVDLEYRAEMLDYSRRVRVAVPEGEQERIHTRLLKPPTKGLRNWRKEMSAEDLALFEALAGRELEEFGYERAVPDLSLVVRGKAAVALAANGVRRMTWKARTTAIAAFKHDGLPPSRRW